MFANQNCSKIESLSHKKNGYCKRSQNEIIYHLTNVNNSKSSAREKRGEDVNRCLFPVYLILAIFFFALITAVMSNLRKCFFLRCYWRTPCIFMLTINVMAIKL